MCKLSCLAEQVSGPSAFGEEYCMNSDRVLKQAYKRGCNNWK